MIIDITGGFWTSMAIIHTHEGTIWPGIKQTQWSRLDLALVLKQVVCLDHSHGELTVCVLSAVLVPQKPILPAYDLRA